MMKRRAFITLLGSAAAWPLAASAQQGDRMRRIGVLMAAAESDPVRRGYIVAFREGLQKLGWAEGRNIRVVTRWAVDAEAMQRFAKELVALQPDVILSHSTPTTAALLQETRTIPIVFATVSDRVPVSPPVVPPPGLPKRSPSRNQGSRSGRPCAAAVLAPRAATRRTRRRAA
jgi:ABC-type uncharacterized transport system substrate-binding protein